MQCSGRSRTSHLNLAVSGSISSSSLTGERGTLAENFSGICERSISGLEDEQAATTMTTESKPHLRSLLDFHPSRTCLERCLFVMIAAEPGDGSSEEHHTEDTQNSSEPLLGIRGVSQHEIQNTTSAHQLNPNPQIYWRCCCIHRKQK